VKDTGCVRRRKSIRHTDQKVDNLPPSALVLPGPIFKRGAINKFGDQILRPSNSPAS